MNVSYKYSEKLSILLTVKDKLSGLIWSADQPPIDKDQIALYYKAPTSSDLKKPFICLTIENKDWTNLNACVEEIGEDFDIYRDGELSGTLKFKIYANDPIQREMVEAAIRREFSDYSGKGTPTLFLKNNLYINNREYEIKFVLKRFIDNDSSQNAINNIYEGIVEADIQFPILRISSTIFMTPEYDLTVL